MSNAKHQPAIAFVFVTLVLDTMAGGIAAPVLPKLVGTLGHTDAAVVAEIFGIFGTMFFVAQFFAAPLQGALSDAFGRRPVILISSLGMAADYVVMAWAPDLGWLYTSRLISGITAGGIAAATAYLIDVTPVAERTRIFSLAGAAASTGTALGPALGGLAGSLDLRLPFWIAAGLSLASVLYGWLVLPESLAPAQRAGFQWRHANPVTASLSIARTYPVLKWFALATFFYVVAQMGVNSIYAVYVSYRYGWSPGEIGLYLTSVGIWSMAIQGLFVPFIIKALSERQNLVYGSIILVIGITAGAFVPYGVGYAIAMFVWIVGLVMMNASFNTYVSTSVGPLDQGRTQGMFRSLTSVIGLIAPGAFALMLAASIRVGGKPLSGIPYAMSGVLNVIGLVVTIHALRLKASTPPATTPP